ncbi:prenyltransferase [Pseudodesulfovibrio sp.]|nr:prenyltransferase [Pseudodesulfovibrio sp.]
MLRQIKVIPWLKAARIPSQSYIFLPLLLGETISFNQGYPFSVLSFSLVHLFGVAIQLYIVFANDYADQNTDRRNVTFTPFSGGSRVLVDGDLKPVDLLKASRLMAASSVVVGGILSVQSRSPLPLLLAVFAVILLWMYSYPPVKLSYRGGGELLQMIGVGIVLPLMGYSALTGSITSFPWEVLLVVLPTQLACAIGTAVPDEPSDRIDHKRTVPVLLGTTVARVVVAALHFVTVLQIAWITSMSPSNAPYFISIAILALSVWGQLFFVKSKPGRIGVLGFTFLSVLSTLLSMAILSSYFWQ